MLGRIKEFLREMGGAAQPEAESEPLPGAVAALLVEAASLDGAVAPGERARIAALLQERFALPAEEADTVLARSEERMRRTHQLHPFLRTINARCTEAERIGFVEMLWEVVYADGRAHAFESNLMRRLGGLLHVADIDIGSARRRVLDRLGRETPAGQEEAG